MGRRRRAFSLVWRQQQAGKEGDAEPPAGTWGSERSPRCEREPKHWMPLLKKKQEKSNSGGKKWASEGSRAGPTSLGCSPQNTMGIVKVGKGRQCHRAGGTSLQFSLEALGRECDGPDRFVGSTLHQPQPKSHRKDTGML